MDTKQPFALRGVPAAVVGLLLAARAKGVTVNRTKLAKLLYFADIEAVKRMGRPQSDIPWVWLHYGPYSAELLEVERDLKTAGIMECESVDLGMGYVEQRLRLTTEAPQLEIDQKFAEILGGIVNDFGHLAATTLRDMSYQTPPMLEAQRENAHGARLDLLGGTPAPPMGAALKRMQAVLNRSEIHENEGDLRGMVAELDEWAPGRRRANEALGD